MRLSQGASVGCRVSSAGKAKDAHQIVPEQGHERVFDCRPDRRIGRKASEESDDFLEEQFAVVDWATKELLDGVGACPHIYRVIACQLFQPT